MSGVYIAKLVRQDGTDGENHIPFIVRDDSSHSDIVFQTADTDLAGLQRLGRRKPLRRQRSGDGPRRGTRLCGQLQPADRHPRRRRHRMPARRTTSSAPNTRRSRWLEQNGYDVSYMAGVDADRYGSLLLNHKMYLDVGHDEYWSGQQRTNVEAARDAGVNLSFWSGNEVYWRTRWGNSLSSDGTPYRTLISYKETWSPSASIDPSNEWTGTFRDPRLSPPAIGGGNPENSLTGTDVPGRRRRLQPPVDQDSL